MEWNGMEWSGLKGCFNREIVKKKKDMRTEEWRFHRSSNCAETSAEDATFEYIMRLTRRK